MKACVVRGQLRQNDAFGVILDTFYDRRNGFLFYTNPLGARADQAVTDEGNLNPDWNPVWDVRTGRFDGGWTIEMAIPFKTLSFTPGGDAWGINFARLIARNIARYSKAEEEFQARGGYWAIGDHSSAAEIHEELGVSKRTFKQATGALFRKKVISIEKNGIRLTGQE